MSVVFPSYSASGGSGCRMINLRVTAFFLLSLGSIFVFASFDDVVNAAAPSVEDELLDALIQVQQELQMPPDRNAESDHIGPSDNALPAVENEMLGEEPGADISNELEPEDLKENLRGEEASGSRPLEGRPRTTKRLYTTQRTNARAAARGKSFSGVKLLSVVAMLLMGALVYAFRGKIFGPEEDDDHDEDDVAGTLD